MEDLLTDWPLLVGHLADEAAGEERGELDGAHLALLLQASLKKCAAMHTSVCTADPASAAAAAVRCCATS
jgi:hypothetical protein